MNPVTMYTEFIEIHKVTNVQPGWIFIREDNSFYAPQEENRLHVEESKCNFQVLDVTPQSISKNFGGKNKNWFWERDIKRLRRDKTYKLLYCFVTKEKSIQKIDNADYEYASTVLYAHGIMIMVTFLKCEQLLLNDIKDILFRNWCRNRVTRGDPLYNTLYKIQEVYIYWGSNIKNETDIRFAPGKAFGEVIDALRYICNNDIESVRAEVVKLPENVSNHSELMIFQSKKCKRSGRNKTLVRRLYDYIVGDQEVNHAERGSSLVKDMVRLFETNTNSQQWISTYNSDFRAHQMTSWGLNPEFNEPLKYKHEKMADSIKNFIDLELGNTTEQMEFPPLHGGGQLPQHNSHSVTHPVELKVPSGQMTKHELQTQKNKCVRPLMDSIPSANVNSEIVAAFSNNPNVFDAPHSSTGVPNKGNTVLQAPSNEMTSSKEIQKIKLEAPLFTREIVGLRHNFYRGTEINEGIDRKYILLFGSDAVGMLSLLNLIWFRSQSNEKRSIIKPIVDVKCDVNSSTIYHFGSTNPDDCEFSIIITPSLTSDSLNELKKLLAEGVLNVHALGFVVNSRSETLTSEERSFFSFVRSSFGEVSNHHLMTFVTFCDVSRNFPVICEMKNQSIKAKCILEFNYAVASYGKELDDLEAALAARDNKNVKRVFKFMKDVTPLSIKSTKIAQEKSFAASHLEDSSKGLVEALEQFIRVEKSGQDLKKLVKPIWKLARLVLTMEIKQSSEHALLQLVAKELKNIFPATSHGDVRECFLLLVFNCHDRNMTISLKIFFEYYNKMFSRFYVNINEIGNLINSAVLNDNYVPFFCNGCQNTHMCAVDPKDDVTMTLKYMCSHPGDDHNLWTFRDSINFCRSLCKISAEALKGICDDLPELPFRVTFPLFLNVLAEAFSEYGKFLDALRDSVK